MPIVSARASNNGGGGTSITMNMPGGDPTGQFIINNYSAVSLDAITYANGTFVATGGGGISVASDPTGLWSTANFTGGNGVAYGNGYWVVAGGGGSIYYNTDPPDAHWTSNSQGSVTFQDVAYGNGYWVAVGASGTLWYRATDPTGVWTQNNQGSASWSGVTYGNGFWAIAGTTGNLMYRATDPTGAFTSNAQGTSDFNRVRILNGYFVAVGLNGTLRYHLTDPTGAWTSNAQGTQNLEDVTFGNGYMVAVGDNDTLWYHLTDPTGTWTQNNPSNILSTTSLFGVVLAGGYLVVTGSPSGVAVATAPANGDVLLMQVTARGGSGTTITDPAGWTLLGSQVNSGTTLAQKLYWRLASSEPSSYSVTITSNKASGVIVVVRGVDPSTPASAKFAGQANGSSTTITYPALGSWTSTNGLDLVFGGTATNSTTAAPSSYVESAFGSSTGGGSGSRTTSESAYQNEIGVTTIGSLTATWGSGAVNIGHHIFLAVQPSAPEIRTILQAVNRAASI